MLASRHHGDTDRLSAYLDGRPVARTINFGSALKFCRLAEGVADLYPRFGRTMEWDTAAPQAVLEAAGGAVRTLDGARPRLRQAWLGKSSFHLHRPPGVDSAPCPCARVSPTSSKPP